MQFVIVNMVFFIYFINILIYIISYVFTKNSFDYRRIYGNNKNILNFQGVYESVNNYKQIRIFAKIIKNDILNVDFTNDKNDNNFELSYSYSINNTEKYINIDTKLRFFKIRLSSIDTFSQLDQRLYNVYLLDTQLLETNNDNKLLTTMHPYNLQTDAFGRLRISNPFTLFDSKNIDKLNNKFTFGISGGGVQPYLDRATSTTILECQSNVAGGHIVSESKQRFIYQPGKSLLIMNTFVFGNVNLSNNTSTLTQRVGYYDDNNGIYLEINSDGLFLKEKSLSLNTTTSVKIDNWNGDSLLKSLLDFTKNQIFWIDIEWLGTGSVRTGFFINGEFRLAQSFHHANVVDDVYITSAQLPVRYEIIAPANTAGIFKQICSTVISEGGYDGKSIIRHIGTDSSNNLITNIVEGNLNKNIGACAIRIGTDPSGVIDNSIDASGSLYNGIIIPSQLSIFVNTPVGNANDTMSIVEYTLLLNPTIILGDEKSWRKYTTLYPADTSSVVEYLLQSDFSGNGVDTISGGIAVTSGYISLRTSYNLASPSDFNIQIGHIIDSINPTKYKSDIFVLMLKLIFAGNRAITNIAAQIGWFEL